MSAVRPNARQFGALAEAATRDTGPVVMLNLLKFRRGGGRREYGRYGDAVRAMVEGQGGRIVYLGRCEQVLVGGDAETWDAVALVEYPSRQAFIEMVSRPDYRRAHEHREAGLERTLLVVTTPVSG
jgi:uncharacterized protein (DUF1330 family)